jgi:hypothetical protein
MPQWLSAPTPLRDALVAAQSFEDDPDLLFRRKTSARPLAHRSLLGLGLGVSLNLQAAVVQIHLNPNTWCTSMPILSVAGLHLLAALTAS